MFHNKIQEYETRLQEYETRLHEYETRLQAIEGGNAAVAPRRRVRDEGGGSQRNVRARQGATQMSVFGCGIDAINGIYTRDGECDHVPKYVRRTRYEGREVAFAIYRYRSQISHHWIISSNPLSSSDSEGERIFYYNESVSSGLPPNDGWESQSLDNDPPPRCLHILPQYRDNNFNKGV